MSQNDTNDIYDMMERIFESLFNSSDTSKLEEKVLIKPDHVMTHIDDLRIGDEILIEIPTICYHIGRVHFINRKEKFVFIDGDENDEDEFNFQFFPDENGFYSVFKN